MFVVSFVWFFFCLNKLCGHAKFNGLFSIGIIIIIIIIFIIIIIIKISSFFSSSSYQIRSFPE